MSLGTEISMQNLVKIFNPKSIGVINIKNAKDTLPFDILHNILKIDFTEVAFPVSPGEKPCDATTIRECLIRLSLWPLNTLRLQCLMRIKAANSGRLLNLMIHLQNDSNKNIVY